jgi:hypothetical protein
VASPGAALQALQKTAAFANAATMLDQTRQPFHQAFIVSRDGVRRVIFENPQIDPNFVDGDPGPQVGTAHMVHASKLNRWKSHGWVDALKVLKIGDSCPQSYNFKR